MKIDCKVIEDLLPLYMDGVCSPQTRIIVDEHLKECEDCSRLVVSMKNMPFEQITSDITDADNILKKGFKKIRRRWIVSITAMLMIVPIVLIGLLIYHEASGEGIAFSNIDEIYSGYRYLYHIKNGKFEKAAEMVDFTRQRYDLVDSVAHMTKEEYQVYMKERLIEKLNEYDKLGIYIDNIKYDYSYRQDEQKWAVCMSFYENYPDGSRQKIVADFNGDTMYAGAYHFPEKCRVERDIYIDEILSLYSEDDTIDYQDFYVTFELKKGEKVIINRNNDSKYKFKGAVNITYGTASSLIDEPYNQNKFESSVPGKYSIVSYTDDHKTVFLKKEDLDIKIVKY